jgi:hypothetical protein
MAMHNSGRQTVLLYQGLRRKEKQQTINPGISPISFFPLPIPIFLDVEKEVRREWRIVREDVGV